MTGRPAYDRETYAEDIKALRTRGLTIRDVARQLGISQSTAYRILAAAAGDQRDRPAQLLRKDA